MPQDFYTLEEAANLVRMSPDDLKALARKGELRSFQDRGTWRFRAQDIEELARRRGMGSDPDLVIRDAPSPKPADSPAPRSPGKSREAEVFDFELPTDEENIGVGQEFLLEVPGSSRKLGSSKKGPKSQGPKSPGPKSPAPKPGSDSDVRLVADGSDVDFQLTLDSDAKLVDDSVPPQAKPRGRTGMTGPASPRPGAPDSRRRSGIHPPVPPVDSGVRLVPMDSDSDVRIVGPGSDEVEVPLGAQGPRSHSDSDIRLEKHLPPSSDEGLLTEEINLDEELRKEEEQRQAAPQAKIRPKPTSAADLPSSSPFELSEADLNLPPEESEPQVKSKTDSSSDFELTPGGPSDSSLLTASSSDFELTPGGGGLSSSLELSSSDFDLTPAGESSSPLESASDDEFHLELPDDEVSLGEMPAADADRPESGISLDKPADSGISLEQGGDGSDEIEFELSLDAESTPKPSGQAKAPAPEDSDSEFELTLDADDSAAASSDSEFELTLDTEEPGAPADSDSEFELTLDDSGGLSPLDGDASPQVKSDSGEQDIFETDFEVPGLEEESGSEAMALEDADTGLDSSDFDIALDETDTAAEEESGSQVVALDEEEDLDDAAATMQKPARKAKGKKQAAIAVEEDEELEAEVEEEEPGLDLGLDEEGEEVAEEEEEPARTVVKEKLIPAAPWGAMPVVLMLPCVVVMIVVMLLGFELVQSMNGYKSPGLVTRTLTDLLGKQK